MAKSTTKKRKVVNKTAAIKEALQTDAGLSPAALAEKLTKQGIKVSAAYVSTVKSKSKREQAGAPTGKQQVRHSVKNGSHRDNFEMIFEAVLQSGADEVKRMADRAEQLIEKTKAQISA